MKENVGTLISYEPGSGDGKVVLYVHDTLILWEKLHSCSFYLLFWKESSEERIHTYITYLKYVLVLSIFIQGSPSPKIRAGGYFNFGIFSFGMFSEGDKY